MPFITNANGLFDTNFTFEFGAETSVLESCSLVFQNQFYVFGGDLESRTRDFRPGFGMKIRLLLSLSGHFCQLSLSLFGRPIFLLSLSYHCTMTTVVIVMLVSDKCSLLSFFV